MFKTDIPFSLQRKSEEFSGLQPAKRGQFLINSSVALWLTNRLLKYRFSQKTLKSNECRDGTSLCYCMQSCLLPHVFVLNPIHSDKGIHPIVCLISTLVPAL